MRNSHDDMDKKIGKYITQEDTDYAILLNGSWGCGKTYYIREKFIPKENKNNIYKSLNGVADMNTFIKSIYFSIAIKFDENDISNKMFKKVKDIMGSFCDSKVNLVMTATDAVFDIISDSICGKIINKAKEKGLVIIIDDLERISDKLDITDVLGKLYSNFISNGIKVIFIADESKINNKKEEYLNEKEKYVRFTIPFATKKYEVIKYIWQTIIQREISSDEMEAFEKIFYEQQINLRTVKYVLDLYAEMLKYYDNELKDVKKYKYPKILFYSICAYSKFYKQENAELEKLLEELGGYVRNMLKNTGQDSNNENVKYYNFVDEHINSGSLIIREFLPKFVFGELLDTEALRFFLTIHETYEEPLFTLDKYKMLEKDKVLDLLNQINENLNNKKYTIRNASQIYNLFMPLAERFKIANKNEIKQKLMNSVFDSANAEELRNTFEYIKKDNFCKIPQIFPEFNSKIDERYKEFISNEDKSFASNFYSFLQNCNFMDDILQKMEIYSVFSMLEKEGYFEKIVTMPNKSIRFFTDYIRYKIYHLSNANEFYYGEIHSLKKLAEQCRNKSGEIKDDDFLKSDALMDLAKIIDETVKHIDMCKNV